MEVIDKYIEQCVNMPPLVDCTDDEAYLLTQNRQFVFDYLCTNGLSHYRSGDHVACLRVTKKENPLRIGLRIEKYNSTHDYENKCVMPNRPKQPDLYNQQREEIERLKREIAELKGESYPPDQTLEELLNL